MNKNDLIVLLMLSSMTLFVTSIGFAIAWVRARERALRATIAAPEPLEPSVRLQRLEQTVDATAIEVERISEALRFTTRLLVDRSNAAAAAGSPSSGRAPERVITPH